MLVGFTKLDGKSPVCSNNPIRPIIVNNPFRIISHFKATVVAQRDHSVRICNVPVLLCYRLSHNRLLFCYLPSLQTPDVPSPITSSDPPILTGKALARLSGKTDAY